MYYLRRFTDFILKSRTQAMAAVFVIAFLPYIKSIGILIAALVTLLKGAREGAYVFAAATLPLLIKGYFAATASNTPDVTLYIMLGIVIASSFLAWGFSVLLQQYNNWNIVLEAVILFGIIVVVSIHLLYPDIQQWWATQLTYYYKEMLARPEFQLTDEMRAAAEQMQIKTINEIKYYATGVMIGSILFTTIIQLLVARWWQAALVNPGGLRKELYQVRLGHIAGFIFVIDLALAYFGSEVALDVLPVMCGVFAIAGLSLIHSAMSMTRFGWLWLILLYAGLVKEFAAGIIIISIIALFDTGFNFRKRFQF